MSKKMFFIGLIVLAAGSMQAGNMLSFLPEQSVLRSYCQAHPYSKNTYAVVQFFKRIEKALSQMLLRNDLYALVEQKEKQLKQLEEGKEEALAIRQDLLELYAQIEKINNQVELVVQGRFSELDELEKVIESIVQDDSLWEQESSYLTEALIQYDESLQKDKEATLAKGTL
ncbi:MAG: hypothetical protein AB7R69_02165 [Candidatus Babeliales bacterium]